MCETAPFWLPVSTPTHDPYRLSAAIQYERHEPEKTLLHEVDCEQLEPFLARARGQGAPVARFMEREIRAYLTFSNSPCQFCQFDGIAQAASGLGQRCADRRQPEGNDQKHNHPEHGRRPPVREAGSDQQEG